MTSPSPPPRSPIVDGAGRITPEWFRWFFQNITTGSGTQQGLIDLLQAGATQPVPDPVPTQAEMAMASLRVAVPADPSPDFGDFIRVALALLPPADPMPDPDQMVMRAMMMSVPT